MTHRINLLCMLVVFALVGCTSIQVQHTATPIKTDRIYIRNNPKVTVPGFEDIIRDAVARRGLPNEVVSLQADLRDKYVITYTGLRSWDIVTYLSHAEFRLEKNGTVLSSAIFHLNGKGGYALTKYRGTKTKLDPVLDELLADVVYEPNKLTEGTPVVAQSPSSGALAPETAIGSTQNSTAAGPQSPPTKSPAEQLLELKKLLDAGAITPDEYAAKKKIVLEKL